ncbi:MAG: hypothetical protein EBZ36_02980 [Acidobacteria bacterium]|nr:hypothetical protein [Acidobacteriota bacterium]
MRDNCSTSYRHLLATSLLLLGAIGSVACDGGGAGGETAYVVPERVRLRSSTAQASRVTSELRGADAVRVINRLDSEDGTPWVEVRSPGGETGWAEARFFVAGEVVDSSRRLAEKYKTVRAQAQGRSKAALKLRLTPDRQSDDNVAVLLPAGAPLEIVARERRPRPAAQLNTADGDDIPPPADRRYDDWLLVRVRDFSVVSTGWIYGGSVSIDIPPDIVYFISNGRRITGWQKIGTVTGDDGRSGDHYLILEERISNPNPDFDFDRVKVLAYDPVTRDYLTPFREDISGRYPVSLDMVGSRGTFRLTATDRQGRPRELRYQLELGDRSKVIVSRINLQTAQ